MARAGAGPGGHLVGVDREAALGVEAIGDDAVGALGRQVEELALAIERIVVRPHVLLLGAMRPQRALDRGEGRVGAERAVGLYGKHRDRIGAVVGDEQELAGRVEGEMDRIVATGRLAADHPQVPGTGIDRVGGDVAAVAMHRVEEPAALVDRQERRILQPSQQLHVLERPGAPVDAIDVDAFAPAVALGSSVAADICENCHAASMPSAGGGDNRRNPVRAGWPLRERFAEFVVRLR